MDNYIKFEFLSLPINISIARSAAACFAAGADPTLETIADVRTAVSEAVTNAVVHAYPDSVGRVVMECELNGGVLAVTVSDDGCGIADVEQAMQPFFTTGNEDERTGMGFAVMNAFMDMLEVKSSVGKGTVVTMKKLLSAEDKSENG